MLFGDKEMEKNMRERENRIRRYDPAIKIIFVHGAIIQLDDKENKKHYDIY